MAEEIPTRTGEAFNSDDESQILDAIARWLDRDVKDKVLALDHADEYPHEMVEQMKLFMFQGEMVPHLKETFMKPLTIPASISLV